MRSLEIIIDLDKPFLYQAVNFVNLARSAETPLPDSAIIAGVDRIRSAFEAQRGVTVSDEEVAALNRYFGLQNSEEQKSSEQYAVLISLACPVALSLHVVSLGAYNRTCEQICLAGNFSRLAD